MKGKQIKLALYGSMGSGKDFAADYLISKYGFTRYAFADNVKVVAETWFPDLYGDGSKKPRKLLQAIGTKFREIDEDVWIDALLEDIKSNSTLSEKDAKNIVITDCRMPNEYKRLKENGYIFIRIITSENIRKQRMIERGDVFSSDSIEHHTESFYDSFEYDHSISNSSTPYDLYRRLDYLINVLESDVQ